AAETLGERGRRRGDDRTRRREDQQLERQRAPEDSIAPRAVVAGGTAPAPPEPTRLVEPRLDLSPRREHQRVGVRRRERDQRDAAGLGDEAPRERVVLDGRVARVPRLESECIATAGRDEALAASLDPRRPAAVVEA